MDKVVKRKISDKNYLIIPSKSKFKTGTEVFLMNAFGFLVIVEANKMYETLIKIIEDLRKKLPYEKFIEERWSIYSSIERCEVIKTNNRVLIAEEVKKRYNIGDYVLLQDSGDIIKLFNSEENYKEYLKLKKSLHK